MPIYEYKAKRSARSCAHCKQGFECLQQLSDPPLARCPQCGSQVSKQISSPVVGGSRSGLDDRAKNAGFHKLQRTGKGEYEKKY